jgi:hypothetical protein
MLGQLAQVAMNTNSRTSISETLRKAIGKIVVFPKDQPPDLPYRHQGVEINFAYGEDIRHELEQVRAILFKHEGWGQKVSEKAIYDRIFDVVKRILLTNGGSRSDEHLGTLFSLIDEHAVEQIVCLPLFGITMESDSMCLGRVILERMTRERVEQIASGNPAPLANYLKLGLEEGVYAVFRTVAEPQRAKEIAIEETRRALDLLRLSIILLELERPPQLTIIVGMEHETNFNDEHRKISIVPADGRSYQMHFGAERRYSPLTLDADTVKRMEGIGVLAISELLQKAIHTFDDFENTLLRAIYWFANYQTQFENENRLLCLITCLETFFTPKDRDPIGTAIAEAVAFFTSDELAARKSIKRLVKDMYQLRSAVSHGGKKAVLDSQLREILEISRTLMTQMIARRGEFKSRDAVLNWVEEQKLG